MLRLSEGERRGVVELDWREYDGQSVHNGASRSSIEESGMVYL
jgi:hypothetical protein